MQEQQINQITQPMQTFFIPNVPTQSVTGGISHPQSILLTSSNNGNSNGHQTNFIQSVRMPISSVNQWTAAPRIMLSQSTNNEHFIMHNRPDIQGNQTSTTGTIGVNPRFIPAHSFVVTQPINPNQIKHTFPPQIQIPLTNNNNNNISIQNMSVPSNTNIDSQMINNNTAIGGQLTKLGQISSNIITNSNNNNNSKCETSSLIINNESSNCATSNVVIDKLDNRQINNSNSTVNCRRLNELLQGIDPLLQMDEDLQEVFSSFLEEFLTNVLVKASELSKLRSSNSVDIKDLQYIFERDWNIYVPGYPNNTSNDRQKKAAELDVHKLRMALIQKQCKK